MFLATHLGSLVTAVPGPSCRQHKSELGESAGSSTGTMGPHHRDPSDESLGPTNRLVGSHGGCHSAAGRKEVRDL